MIIDKPVPDNGVGWFPMPNESAQDRTLSLRARGLLSLILSYRDGADLTVEKLATVLKESEDVISKARKELVSGGYIIHSRYAAKRGRWATETFAGNSPEVARAAAEQWQNKQNPSSRRVDGLPRVGGTEGSDSRVVGDTEGSVDRGLNTNKRNPKKTQPKKKTQEENQPPAATTEKQEPHMRVHARDPEPPDLAPAWAAPADEPEQEDPLPVEDPPTHPGDCEGCGVPLDDPLHDVFLHAIKTRDAKAEGRRFARRAPRPAENTP